MSVRISIHIDSDTADEESEIALIIGRGLADRGFKGIAVIANDTIYTDDIFTAKIVASRQETAKDFPITTSSSLTVH